MKGMLGRKYFGLPLWVIALVAALALYYFYAKGGAASDSADPNAPDEAGGPISYPATLNIVTRRKKRKKKKATKK